MINTAICSYGLSGKVFHAPLLTSHPDFHLHTVMQRSNTDAKSDYPEVQIVTDYEQILKNKDIDLVVVNTPNELHFSMAKAALEAGKHVVVEKPFTVNLAEGTALLGLAESEKKVLGVFQNKRLECDFLDAQSVLQSNVLGRVVEVEWHYDRFRAHVTHKRWKEDQRRGSGTWFDLGIHMVDAMLCLFGMPNSVTADMRSLRREEGATDYFNVRCDYDDHRVILRSNTFVSEKGPTVTIHGDRGSFLKFGQDVQESQLAKGIRPGHEQWGVQSEDNFYVLHKQTTEQSVRETHASHNGRYEDFYSNIADAIQSNAPLKFDATQPLKGVQVLLAAQQSAKQKRTIEV